MSTNGLPKMQLAKGVPEVKDGSGQNMPLAPVKMNAKANIGAHETIKHMRSAFRRNLPHFYRIDAHAGEAVLVGTGPSVAEHIEDIRRLHQEGAMIFAIKGAHDYLLDHGIVPDIAVAVDGQQKIANLYQNPREDITYLIASQCHPDVYDALEKQKVVIWNCFTKKAMEYWQKWLAKKRREDKIFFVNGGSTSGLRAVTLAWLMGFRRINLVGYDSCLKITGDDPQDQANQLLKITGEKNPKELMVVVVDDRNFFCDPAMSCQGNEFLPQIKGTDDLQVKVWGDGFIPYVSHQAACRGDWQFVFPEEDWWRLDDPRRGSIVMREDAENQLEQQLEEVADV